MNLLPGEIVLIDVPFHQAAGTKVRPVIVVLDSGDSDAVIIPITSQPRVTEFDLALSDWRIEGLSVPSFARTHKISVVTKFNLRRRVGHLSSTDRRALRDRLQKVLAL